MTRCIYVVADPGAEFILHGFAYLLNKFWPGNFAAIIGARVDGMGLPDNFATLGKWSADCWSDRLIDGLHGIDDPRPIIMTAYDWITGPVSESRVQAVERFARMNAGKILRVDLSSDMANGSAAKRWQGGGADGLVYSPKGAPGCARFSPSIWDRDMLQGVLLPGDTQAQAQEWADTSAARHCRGIAMGAVRAITPYSRVCVAETHLMYTPGLDEHSRRHMRRMGWLSWNCSGDRDV